MTLVNYQRNNRQLKGTERILLNCQESNMGISKISFGLSCRSLKKLDGIQSLNTDLFERAHKHFKTGCNKTSRKSETVVQERAKKQERERKKKQYPPNALEGKILEAKSSFSKNVEYIQWRLAPQPSFKKSKEDIAY